MSSIEKAMEQKDMAGSKEVFASAINPLSLNSLDHNSVRAKTAFEQRERSSKMLNLDLQILSQKGFITPNDPRSRMAEEYRMVKRPLLKRALDRSLPPDEHSNLIMVTSALSGEGKTFTAINLAMSIVMEYNHTVLLIDADVVRPELSRILNIQGRSGLVEVLLDSTVDLADVMARTNIPNLRVVGSGQPHSRSTELLASYQMAELAKSVAGRYPERIVIVDSSPLLATSQPSVLAQFMGQIVLVVEVGRTPQTAVGEAISLLDQSKLIWVVMNKGWQSWGSPYYGNYYYGSYSDG
jgi:exopolysaccharide/PEP-CTERM locus tyrosine autokinase